MRFTVQRKIVLGTAVIVCLAAVSLFIVYRGLNDLHDNLREIDERAGPRVEAAYEMEINLIEVAAQVLKYMESRDPSELTQIASDRQDFERFHAQYRRLTTSPRGRELATRIEKLYGEFVSLADAMIANRDAESVRFAQVMQYVENIDETLDERLEARIDRSAPGAMQKLVDSINLESDVAEVGIWLANYRHTRREQDRDRMWSNVEEFERQAAGLRRNRHLTAGERRTVEEIERAFAEMRQAIRDVLALDAQAMDAARRFQVLRNELDDLLDEEIQALAISDLAQPIIDADEEVVAVARRVGVLLPLFLLSACGVAGLLIHNLTGSVGRLMAGTDALTRGDLNARIQVRGRDELADLATRFNQMVDQLQRTTVSKAALEESESALRAAYHELRQQTADRERAESGERRLRAELQRNEMLTRMGSLVAGVAHEARNPLFGISSTVDAIEARLARLGSHTAYADHLTVLRREIFRLNTLTRDLLEYGKPARIERAPARAEDVSHRAIEACRALARQQGIAVSQRVAPDVDLVTLDAARMVQVLQNLIENAIHHSPRGGTAIVEVSRVHEDGRTWVRWAVIDQGSGIAAEDLPHIFEPFFSRRAQGTGLGLSIVDRIVDQHGGRTGARNGTHRGAVLTVDVPLDHADSEEDFPGVQRAAQHSHRR